MPGLPGVPGVSEGFGGLLDQARSNPTLLAEPRKQTGRGCALYYQTRPRITIRNHGAPSQARQSRGCSEAQARTSRGEVFGGRPARRSRDPRHLAVALDHTGRQGRRGHLARSRAYARRDHAGFPMVRDWRSLAAGLHQQDLEPAALPRPQRNNANECHRSFYCRCSLVEGYRLHVPRNVKRNQDAALEHLPRRERRLVVLAQAIGSESAAWGVRIIHEHASCTARRLPPGPLAS